MNAVGITLVSTRRDAVLHACAAAPARQNVTRPDMAKRKKAVKKKKAAAKKKKR
jgi:hypothetical protein